MALSTLIRGDDWKFTFTVLDPSGAPIDITGGKIWLTFKDQTALGQPDSNANFQLADLDIQDANDPENLAASGVVVLRAKYNDSAGPPPTNSRIPVGKYSYDAQYQGTVAQGEFVATIESGSVTVAQEVTATPT